MTDFSWNSLWQLAQSANQNSHQADKILRLLSQALPIESLSLLVLLGQPGTTDKPGSLRRVLYVEKSGHASTETLDLPCSLSRWAELQKWALSGALLEQPSPKRSGKLAWIATEELRGSLMAFGLQLGEPATEGVFAGIVVFEIEHARSIQPESNQPSSSSEEPTFYEMIPESSYLQAASILEQPPVPLVQNQAEGRLLPLNELIKQHIEKVLVRCAGQVEGKRGAARILQINPHTLRAKMRKLGIRWADYRRDDDEALECASCEAISRVLTLPPSRFGLLAKPIGRRPSNPKCKRGSTRVCVMRSHQPCTIAASLTVRATSQANRPQAQ
jgi:hypothetical protein